MSYLIGFDSDNKECLISCITPDLFEIIHECNSGMISSRFTVIGAKLAGFSTARVNGKVVEAKDSLVNRFKVKMKQRQLKQKAYTF